MSWDVSVTGKILAGSIPPTASAAFCSPDAFMPVTKLTHPRPAKAQTHMTYALAFAGRALFRTTSTKSGVSG
ncbi:hypothetical protein GCM10019059_17530 [Camelimonas fluminis]|nr:hypothetical protein GCM10019059_17530 [Camelimonas fluminis]